MVGGLIVSVQHQPGQPFHEPELLARIAAEAEANGASAIRANGPDAIAAIREAVDIPIIGIYKDRSFKAYITPTIDHAMQIVDAGAEVIAVDATALHLSEAAKIRKALEKYSIEVVADVSSFSEGFEAQKNGFDVVSTTLVGYTGPTKHIPADCFDFALLCALVHGLDIPVIAEGHIRTPADARRAMRYGAHAVVVGAAITGPGATTQWFKEAICG
jgi:N-acylglucosamine-6-phosphate 2-epimerase